MIWQKRRTDEFTAGRFGGLSMITLRKSEDRGHFDHGWLNTYHTFSFASYHDPKHMGFRALRVMNEDRVRPGAGFGTHEHENMEILSYVLEGSLEHRDSMDNGSVLRAGDFQRMTAGAGVRHSEFNPSSKEPLHFYQIWLLPEKEGLEPSYEEWRFDDREEKGKLQLVASRDGRDGSLSVHQDVDIFLSSMNVGERVSHRLKPARHAWLQVIRGEIELHEQHLTAGDGAALSAEPSLRVKGLRPAEVMLFDMA